MTLTRREALGALAIAGVALGAPRRGGTAEPPASPPSAPPFELPPLPYAADALEPQIDAETMRIHHDKHHAAYVAGLNAAVAATPELAGRPLESLLAALDTVPEPVRPAVRNHGGGHFNHSLFWTSLDPRGGVAPTGELAAALSAAFGSFASFTEAFQKAGAGVFGSGWAWLVADARGRLELTTTPNQDTPLATGRTPLLGIDVWEHAYYLRYQNRRAEYLAAIARVVHWPVVEERWRRSRG